jgi:hypothetical protein
VKGETDGKIAFSEACTILLKRDESLQTALSKRALGCAYEFLRTIFINM